VVTFTGVSNSTSVGQREQVRATHAAYAPPPLGISNTNVGVLFLHALQESDAGTPAGYEECYAIAGELSPSHWLHRSLLVRVQIEGPEFVAEQPDLEIHAFGGNAIAAIMALRDEIVEQYERLSELGDQVAPRLKRQRELLASLLLPPDARA
jgi:hypothetical protein